MSAPASDADAQEAAFWQLAHALLAELAATDTPQSAARLCKRLGVRMSTLQRALALLGTGGADYAGLGWVQQQQEEERLLLQLSENGRHAWQQQLQQQQTGQA